MIYYIDSGCRASSFFQGIRMIVNYIFQSKSDGRIDKQHMYTVAARGRRWSECDFKREIAVS